MKKNNKILILIIALFIIIVIVVSSFFVYKNLRYREVILSIDDVIEVNSKIQSGEDIDLNYFREFKLTNKEENDGLNIYTYDMGGKYEFEIDINNDQIVAMFLINKVTYEYVNILEDSLDEFLQFN